MNSFKTWLVDVGLWEVEPEEAWTWNPRRFRPFFWLTVTNQIHRAYRNIICELAVRLQKETQEAYVQGARDGILQYRESLALQDQGLESPPPYLH